MSLLAVEGNCLAVSRIILRTRGGTNGYVFDALRSDLVESFRFG